MCQTCKNPNCVRSGCRESKRIQLPVQTEEAGTYPASMLETVKIIANLDENEMTHEEKVKQLAFVMTEMFAVHKKGPERVAYLLSELEREGTDFRERSMNSNNTKFRMEIIRHFFPEPQPFPKWKTFDVLPSGIRGSIWTLDPSTFETRCLDYDNDPENEEEPVGFAIKLSGDWHTPPDGLLWMYEAEFITLIESAF